MFLGKEKGRGRHEPERIYFPVKKSRDKKWIMDVIKQAVDSGPHDDSPRGRQNLIIAMEELAELSKEISKELRGKGDLHHILEELADVQLSIYYVQEICGISSRDLRRAVTVKAERIKRVLNRKGMYR